MRFVDFRQNLFYHSPKLGFGLRFWLLCSIGFRDGWVNGGDDRRDRYLIRYLISIEIINDKQINK